MKQTENDMREENNALISEIETITKETEVGSHNNLWMMPLSDMQSSVT